MKGFKIFKKISAVLMIFALAVTVCAIPGFAQSIDGEAAAQDNVFERAFSAVSSNLSEILCSLTLIASLILAFAYKKGLLPIVSGAVSAIGKGIGKLQGEAEKFNEESSERIRDISTKLGAAAGAIEAFALRLTELEGKLDQMNKSNERYDAILKAVSAEAELLYDVFMSSALPQYQKDAVAKRISEINGALSEG